MPDASLRAASEEPFSLLDSNRIRSRAVADKQVSCVRIFINFACRGICPFPMPAIDTFGRDVTIISRADMIRTRNGTVRMGFRMGDSRLKAQ